MEPSEVAELLEQLSEQLSPVAQHTFELIKTQMMIEAVIGSIFAGIGLVIAIVLSIIAVRVWTNGDHRYATDGEMFLLFGTMLVWIVLLVTVLIYIAYNFLAPTFGLPFLDFGGAMTLWGLTHMLFGDPLKIKAKFAD
jgi:hypothetical protein